MTYRERRQARAKRLEDWANKREQKSAQAYKAVTELTDGMPLGQPILVGHHSEGKTRRHYARVDANMRASVENDQKAEDFRERAANIREAADQAIYKDDPDAIERLAKKLATLEALRDAIRAFNQSCRRGQPDRRLLTEQQWREIRLFGTVARAAPGGGGPLPGYLLSNLGANIRRTRLRLERLRRAETKREERE